MSILKFSYTTCASSGPISIVVFFQCSYLSEELVTARIFCRLFHGLMGSTVEYWQEKWQENYSPALSFSGMGSQHLTWRVQVIEPYYPYQLVVVFSPRCCYLQVSHHSILPFFLLHLLHQSCSN